MERKQQRIFVTTRTLRLVLPGCKTAALTPGSAQNLFILNNLAANGEAALPVLTQLFSA